MDLVTALYRYKSSPMWIRLPILWDGSVREQNFTVLTGSTSMGTESTSLSHRVTPGITKFSRSRRSCANPRMSDSKSLRVHGSRAACVCRAAQRGAAWRGVARCAVRPVARCAVRPVAWRACLKMGTTRMPCQDSSVTRSSCAAQNCGRLAQTSVARSAVRSAISVTIGHRAVNFLSGPGYRSSLFWHMA